MISYDSPAPIVHTRVYEPRWSTMTNNQQHKKLLKENVVNIRRPKKLNKYRCRKFSPS